MKVVKPITVTDAVLVSSTLPETDHAAWSSGATYAVGDRVVHAHRIVESLQAGNNAHTPGAAGSETWWLDVGPTNRWAMFDNVVNTLSTATGEMTIVLAPGLVDSVGLVDLQGATVRVRMTDGATVVYDQTQSLDGSTVLDWYDYFFEPFDTVGSVLFRNLPQYLNGQVTVTISGPATVSVGALVLGKEFDLGDTGFGATAGITDYSRKDTNAFGAVTLVRRAYAKRSSTKLQLPNTHLRRVRNVLADLRATPCLWVGADDTSLFEPLVVFGWYRDFQIEIAYPQTSFCTLEIEGMT